jgi:hypothetical protein
VRSAVSVLMIVSSLSFMHRYTMYKIRRTGAHVNQRCKLPAVPREQAREFTPCF